MRGGNKILTIPILMGIFCLAQYLISVCNLEGIPSSTTAGHKFDINKELK